MSATQLELYGGLIVGVGGFIMSVYNAFSEKGKQRADDARDLRKDLQNDLVQRAEYFEGRANDCDRQCRELRESCDRQCRELRLEVEGVRGELYNAFEGLEDRVIPMLDQDPVDAVAIRAEVRKIVHDGRTNLRSRLMDDYD